MQYSYEMTENDESLSSGTIAVVLIIAAAMLGFVMSWVSSLEFRRPPEQLSQLSEPAVEVVAISAPRGERPAPVVRIAGGEHFIYRQISDKSINNWEPAGNSFEDDSEPCSRWIEWRLRATAGNTDSCLQADASVEWCPGPLVVAAINSAGEIWWWEKHEFCWFAAIMFFVVPYSIGGVVISLVVVAIREFFF